MYYLIGSKLYFRDNMNIIEDSHCGNVIIGIDGPYIEWLK